MPIPPRLRGASCFVRVCHFVCFRKPAYASATVAIVILYKGFVVLSNPYQDLATRACSLSIFIDRSRQNCIKIIIWCGATVVRCTTNGTLVMDCISMLVARRHTNWFHRGSACVRAITRIDVYMQAEQTLGTVIATAGAQRWNRVVAVLAYEAFVVFTKSLHMSRPEIRDTAGVFQHKSNSPTINVIVSVRSGQICAR